MVSRAGGIDAERDFTIAMGKMKNTHLLEVDTDTM